MKKSVMSLLMSMVFLGVLPLHADKIADDIAEQIRSRFGFATNISKSEKKAKQSVSTNVFAYQYTTDGWLQLLAVYSDSIISTNLAGPREGFQIIMMGNGALIDTSNSYKIHSDYCSHKYSWGEVRTYKTYQTLIVK